MKEFFVSSYQKVATFRLAGNAKQGGNVAGYFMTPRGSVLHVIAGPVDAETFLREARWAVETWKLVQLDAPRDMSRARLLMAKAHQDRLKKDRTYNTGWTPNPRGKATWAQVVRNNQNTILSRLGTEGKVHLLLATNPLPRLEQIYRYVFEKILNEKLSTAPVVKS
jgi:hypothetical protein